MHRLSVARGRSCRPIDAAAREVRHRSDGFETLRLFRFRLALAFPRIVLRNSELAPSWDMRLDRSPAER